MSYSDFLLRFAYYKKRSSVEELLKDPVHRYAIRCRERGAVYVERLNNILSEALPEIKLLDVGCAYGGIAIELAEAGAKVTGVDVIPSYIDLARHNAQSDVDVDFFIGDLTLRSTMRELLNGRIGQFNVFVLNHVLEHVYDTEGMFQNIDLLSTNDSVIFFDVPNGFSIQSYMAEGHTGIFGVSLADPDCWHYFGNPRARIYYRRFEYYRSLMAAHGYSISLVRQEKLTRNEMEHKLAEVIAKSRTKEQESIAPPAILKEAVYRFESEVAHDLVHASEDELDMKYFNYFWRGIAYRSTASIKPQYHSEILYEAWGDD